MICPKCRNNYPKGTTECPDCGLGLIDVLGEADAVDNAELPKMKKIIVNSDDDFSPVLYKTESTAAPVSHEKNVFAFVMLAIGILLLATGIFFFVKGNHYSDVLSFGNINMFFDKFSAAIKTA